MLFMRVARPGCSPGRTLNVINSAVLSSPGRTAPCSTGTALWGFVWCRLDSTALCIASAKSAGLNWMISGAGKETE